MSSAEQPLKKRKLYEPAAEPTAPPELSQSLPPKTLAPDRSYVSLPPSEEEIAVKRKNRDEIRVVYECYKRIRAFLSRKDNSALTTDIEQAYLSLITSSRGCTSVQRIVADLIPRYASYCPAALEAAVKVVINMHDWNLAMINRGKDADGVAFDTARVCIFGLTDICCAVSLEAPKSSVIRGIRSAVFRNMLIFFVSSFEGKDIFQIVDKEILKIQDSADIFAELKQKFTDEDEPSLIKLFKFRALNLLWLFFRYPKNMLAACFDLSSLTTEGVHKEVVSFLTQVTRRLGNDGGCQLDKISVLSKSLTGSKGTSPCEVQVEEQVSDNNNIAGGVNSASGSCLLGLVLGKDQSLLSWTFTKYKKLCNLSSFKALVDIKSAFEGVFDSFTELMNIEGSLANSDDDNSDPPNYVGRQSSVPSVSIQCEITNGLTGKDNNLRVCHGTNEDAILDNVTGQHRSAVPLDNLRTNRAAFNHDSGGSRSIDFKTQEPANLSHGRSSMPNDLLNKQTSILRSNSFESRNHFSPVDKNQVSNSDTGMAALRSSTGGAVSDFASPKHHIAIPHSSTTTEVSWYSDGDPSAMDIFSASKQLWVGSLGPDTSEAHVRFQLERFGPLEEFIFFPIKGFTLVEYMHIIDATRAHEYLQRQFQWCMKFMDIGFGTRGAINGIAIGSSPHVYIGNVPGHWVKDEILHEARRALNKGPYMVTDLSCEGALLMEFETPEEAAVVMAHLRHHRRERNNHWPPLNPGPPNVALPFMDAGRSSCAPNVIGIRSNNPLNISNNMIGSPHQPPIVPESPSGSSRTRMSDLSSFLFSLRKKYNINQNSSYFENYMSGNCNTSTMGEDVPSNTLWISFPSVSSQFVTDDELMVICNLAIANTGSVIKLSRANMKFGCGWFVECSSVDGAITVLRSLQGCPGTFLRAEFSQPGKYNSSMELVSPRLKYENHGTSQQGGHSYQSNSASSAMTEMPEVGVRNDSNAAMNHSQGGGHASNTSEQTWTYKKPEMEIHPVPGSIPCIPTTAQGPCVPPPPQVQSSPFIQPPYPLPNGYWDARGLNHHFPLNPISPGTMPTSFHGSVATPFIPASVTPLAQIQGTPSHHFDRMFTQPVVPPPLVSLPPPHPEIQPPLPPSPPPLPQSQPPQVPPPPSSPPPPPPLPAIDSFEAESSGQPGQYQWQGTLSKSGVHYCTIYAVRVDSDICKYSNSIAEPTEWPAKLDMTKRTDFRHVKSTFTTTPRHKREVCELIPSSSGDHKGDFVSYLKQRDCAGVIKIPAIKTIWARLLFILPYSQDLCSMLCISPGPSDSLIALALPKETNFEWV